MKKLIFMALLFSFSVLADSASSGATLCDDDREATGTALATAPTTPAANTGTAANQDKAEESVEDKD